MKNFFANAISNELIFVYGLIALVIILIIVIVIIDKKESRKKPKNLFDTLNMKIISDVNNLTPDDKNEEVKEEKIVPELDIIEMKQKKNKDNFQDLEPIPEVRVEKENFTIPKQVESKKVKEEETELLEDIASNDFSQNEEEDIYIESDLEKTQAQIRVEEITEALKKAQVEEQIEEDKYAKFEEEQEKNAIISYNELKKSFDKLYSENEKIQYIDDDEIPINIDELYQLSKKQEKKETLEDTIKRINEMSTPKKEEYQQKENVTTSTFKSSPLISPVYGIQKPPVETKTTVDKDIQNANQFLQSLKELKNNLD